MAYLYVTTTQHEQANELDYNRCRDLNELLDKPKPLPHGKAEPFAGLNCGSWITTLPEKSNPYEIELGAMSTVPRKFRAPKESEAQIKLEGLHFSRLTPLAFAGKTRYVLTMPRRPENLS